MFSKKIKKFFREFFDLIILGMYLLAIVFLEAILLFSEITLNYPAQSFTGTLFLFLGISLPFVAIFFVRLTQKIKSKIVFE